MKAFAVRKYGGPVVAAEVDEPEMGPNDVLVETAAAGVNPADERIRSGGFKQIFPFDLPFVLGSDVAGQVVAIGDRVRDFAVGDAVFAHPAMDRIGTFAERIAIDAANVAPAPTTVGITEAASLPVVALTAWQILVEQGRVGPGQTVLIHGGAGGVGSIAVQLAKHLGATVATTASASSAEFVRELGADIVIDYRNQDFEKILSDVDLVVDSIGGDNLNRSLRVLRRGGRVIGLAGPPDAAFADRVGVNPLVKLAVCAMSLPTKLRARRLGVSYDFFFVRGDGDQLRKIAALVDDGVLRPIVARVMPFDQTPEALQALDGSGIHGKIVVSRQ